METQQYVPDRKPVGRNASQDPRTASSARNTLDSQTASSASSFAYMPTPDASPKAALTNIVDNIDFGDEQKTLLDELDKLREFGVDRYIQLPQLCVVGDQSSGKSSVLEALSELPFPRSSIRCTRFATQIKLRHSPETSMSVKIIPGPDRDSRERARLAAFPSKFADSVSFQEIMNMATQAICGDNPRFCYRDIFSIEMSGPSKPHLTIVDLPGLIQAANIHQSQADVDAIQELAYDYMRNERTIVLAIVSAATDLELQPVLSQRARQFDPTGARTLGIITKPDKTETPEREALFLELARNHNVRFKLGWHVLRNRAPDEMHFTAEERKRQEMQFFSPPSNWASVGAENLGVETLRQKLSRELIKHVLHEMPAVQREIREQLDETRRQLERLGDRKDTPEEMRDQLRELCEKSQALTRTAMEGQYVDLYGPTFFNPPSESFAEPMRKLRARIVTQNEKFAEEMAVFGHLVEIIEEAPMPTTPGANGQQHLPPPTPVVNSRHPMKLSRADFIRHHVEPLLNASPGLELMMDRNPLLVYTLFRNYSENWPTIAKRHLEEVQAICSDFLQEVIDFIWPEDMRARAWMAFVEEKMEERLKEATKEADKLFKDRTRASKPYDPEHTKRVAEWIAARNKSKPNGAAWLSEFAPDVFLQKMLVYYDLTQRTFVSNIIVQVVERHLVDDLDRIFNITRVVELDDETVIEIAAEDDALRHHRLELRNTRRVLEAGERICRRYMSKRDMSLDEISKPVRKPLTSAAATARFARAQPPPRTPTTTTTPTTTSMPPPRAPPVPVVQYESPQQPQYASPDRRTHDRTPSAASDAFIGATYTPGSTPARPAPSSNYSEGDAGNLQAHIQAQREVEERRARRREERDAREGAGQAPPSIPPRPPKEEDQGSVDTGRRGQVLRGVFGRK